MLAAPVAGCTKILSEHLDTIRVLADLGDANMQLLLGDMYLQGHGVPKDQGIVGAAEGREAAAKWMTHTELRRAQALALKYWERYVLTLRN